jgi:hypothetical protein
MRLVGDTRGQTLQDYVIGVAVVLVATTFVVTTLPNVYDSYDSTTDGIRSSQAERVAEYVVSNYSIDDGTNVLKYDQPGGIHATLSSAAGMDELRGATSLDTATDRRIPPNINIILVNTSTLRSQFDSVAAVDDGKTFSFGDTYRKQPSAQTARVVTLNNDDSDICDQSCWLVVRVW